MKGKNYVEIHGETKSSELKKKLSQNGKKLTGENNPFYGKTHSKEIKSIYRENRLGKSYEEIFGKELAEKIIKKKTKDIKDRKNYIYEKTFYNLQLRNKIISEQNYECAICGRELFKYYKQLHHIDYNKENNNRDNLVYLCVSCHAKTNKKIKRGYYIRELTTKNREIIK